MGCGAFGPGISTPPASVVLAPLISRVARTDPVDDYGGLPEQVGVALSTSFGMAMYLGLFFCGRRRGVSGADAGGEREVVECELREAARGWIWHPGSAGWSGVLLVFPRSES